MPAGNCEIISLSDLILLRVLGAGRRGVSKTQACKDLSVYAPSGVNRSLFRQHVDAIIPNLKATGAVEIGARGVLIATATGRKAGARAVSCKPAFLTSWADIRDLLLIAFALDLPLTRAKSLAGSDGLRTAIVARAHGIKVSQCSSLARLRNALAVKALVGAFGEAIRTPLGEGGGLGGSTARLIAAQHLNEKQQRKRTAASGKTIANDQKLMAVLARRCAGSRSEDPASLRKSIIRSLLAPLPDLPAAAETSFQLDLDLKANGTAKPSVSATPIDGFAKAVHQLARSRASGWPGNRKAYISHVWQSFSDSHPEWGLDEDRFKDLLAEAHRKGHVVLTNADIRDRSNIQDIQQSAVSYKNMEWHLIRVTD